MDMTQNDIDQQNNSTQHYEVLQELGDCYTSVGDYTQAQKYYERAAILAPDEAGPYVGLGVVALHENHLTVKEIAERTGISRERVSAVLKTMKEVKPRFTYSRKYKLVHNRPILRPGSDRS